MKIKRVFLIVLDSFGIGAMPDAAEYGDEGSNTLAAVSQSAKFNVPVLKKLGLFNIDGVSELLNEQEDDQKNDQEKVRKDNGQNALWARKDGEDNTYTTRAKIKTIIGQAEPAPSASFARLKEKSKGKDTTIGHWEIAGIVSEKPLPVFPNGFPPQVMRAFEDAIGRKTLCNLPYSGTEVIKDYGKEHLQTGCPIVYTSADSVFQLAAHEDIIKVNQLYDFCKKARKILTGEYGVGRVIARPFTGEYPFTRTANRHDFSLEPPKATMLDRLKDKGLDVISAGKIYDIFAGRGLTESHPVKSNLDAMQKTDAIADRDFTGLCFVNLVDFDMLYGHRNDADGYANALSQFDKWLGGFLEKLSPADALMITADHGCDPSTISTDHSREYVPLLMHGAPFQQGNNLGTIDGFDFIAKTIEKMFE